MTERGKRIARVLIRSGTALFAAGVLLWYALGSRPLPVQRRVAVAPEGGPPLDMNRATAEQLDELPGIGPALAERILTFRAENGPYAGPEDLQAVPGIGPAIWEDISPYVFFGEEERHADTGGR